MFRRLDMIHTFCLLPFTISLLVLFFLTSCGSGDNRIVVRLPSYPMKSLNPHIWDPQIILAQGTLLEGLFGYDSALNVVPRLAKETLVSPDRKTWTFKLHTDRLWSNGDPVTAYDFVFGWKQFLKPGKDTPMWASFFAWLENGPEYRAGSVTAAKLGFKALNDSVLVVHLVKPQPLRSQLVLPSALPLNRKSFESARKVGSEDLWWRPEHFIGNGPYLPVKFVRGEKIVLEKNPHYVGKVGNVERFELMFRGGNIQVQGFQAGFLDLAYVNTQDDYRFVKEVGYLRELIHETSAPGFIGFQIARTVHPLFDDLRLRRALALAVDKEKITREVLSDKAVPAAVFGPPQDPVLKGLEGYAFDPDSARSLLKESGYLKKRTPIYFFCPPVTDSRGWSPVVEALQKMWQDVGFRIIVQNMDNARLTKYTWGGGYHPGREFNRPGVTLFAGEVLWVSPLMMLRLADHVWYWQNFPLKLKKERKRIALELLDLEKEKRGGSDRDWVQLIQQRQALQPMADSIQAREKDSIFLGYLAERNPLLSFDSLLGSLPSVLDATEGQKKFRQARGILLRSETELLSYLENLPNLEGFRHLAKLEQMGTGEGKELIREIMSDALSQAWILPLYSDKMVYLKHPWLHGVSIGKFGNWSMAHILQNMSVDVDAYREARSRTE